MKTDTAPAPVKAEIDKIAKAIDRAKAPDTSLTYSELIGLLGQDSHMLVILMFSMLNMIPGPPGYGGTMAACTFAFALTMVLGKPIRLPHFIGHRQVAIGLFEKVTKRLAQVSDLVAKISRPRWQFLTGPHTQRSTGLFVMLLAMPMILPIPFINAIPNVGLCVLCVARLNRDGLGVLFGGAVAVLGLCVAAGLVFAVLSLGFAAGGLMQGG